MRVIQSQTLNACYHWVYGIQSRNFSPKVIGDWMWDWIEWVEVALALKAYLAKIHQKFG